MLRYLLLGFVIFASAFYFIPKSRLPLAPVVTHAYSYNLNNYTDTKVPHWLLSKPGTPFTGLAIKKSDGTLLTGPAFAKPYLIPGKWRVHLPFLGNGYFLYKKIGKEIRFLTPDHELLWSKEFYSYPDSNVVGDFVALLTGDNNRVDIVSEDGEPMPQKSVSGNFLSDYRFSVIAGRLLLLFSDGRFVLLEKGQKIASQKIEQATRKKADNLYPTFFAKSAALSYNGSRLAVHYLFEGKDYVAIFYVTFNNELQDKNNADFSGKGLGQASVKMEAEIELEEKFTLPKVYPHLLHIALNGGHVLVAAPDATFLYDLQDEELKTLPTRFASIYRPVYAAPHFLACGDGDTLFVFNPKGRRIVKQKLVTEGRPWRILPARVAKAFAVQTASYVEFFSFIIPKG